MSFGFSPSDVIALISIVSTAYQKWSRACGTYADVTGELDHLLIILERVDEEARKSNSVLVRNAADRRNLGDILSGSRKVVEELSAVVEKHRSLGLEKSRERNWRRIQFAAKDLGSLRKALHDNITRISGYLDVVGLSALGRVERDVRAIPMRVQEIVDGLAAEIRAGRREGSVLTTYDDDEKDVWKQFRRELIGDGMRSSMIHKYKPQIRQYLRRLAEQGLLEELEPDDADSHSVSAELAKDSRRTTDEQDALEREGSQPALDKTLRDREHGDKSQAVDSTGSEDETRQGNGVAPSRGAVHESDRGPKSASSDTADTTVHRATSSSRKPVEDHMQSPSNARKATVEDSDSTDERSPRTKTVPSDESGELDCQSNTSLPSANTPGARGVMSKDRYQLEGFVGVGRGGVEPAPYSDIDEDDEAGSPPVLHVLESKPSDSKFWLSRMQGAFEQARKDNKWLMIIQNESLSSYYRYTPRLLEKYFVFLQGKEFLVRAAALESQNLDDSVGVFRLVIADPHTGLSRLWKSQSWLYEDQVDSMLQSFALKLPDPRIGLPVKWNIHVRGPALQLRGMREIDLASQLRGMRESDRPRESDYLITVEWLPVAVIKIATEGKDSGKIRRLSFREDDRPVLEKGEYNNAQSQGKDGDSIEQSELKDLTDTDVAADTLLSDRESQGSAEDTADEDSDAVLERRQAFQRSQLQDLGLPFRELLSPPEPDLLSFKDGENDGKPLIRALQSFEVALEMEQPATRWTASQAVAGDIMEEIEAATWDDGEHISAELAMEAYDKEPVADVMRGDGKELATKCTEPPRESELSKQKAPALRAQTNARKDPGQERSAVLPFPMGGEGALPFPMDATDPLPFPMKGGAALPFPMDSSDAPRTSLLTACTTATEKNKWLLVMRKDHLETVLAVSTDRERERIESSFIRYACDEATLLNMKSLPQMSSLSGSEKLAFAILGSHCGHATVWTHASGSYWQDRSVMQLLASMLDFYVRQSPHPQWQAPNMTCLVGNHLEWLPRLTWGYQDIEKLMDSHAGERKDGEKEGAHSQDASDSKNVGLRPSNDAQSNREAAESGSNNGDKLADIIGGTNSSTLLAGNNRDNSTAPRWAQPGLSIFVDACLLASTTNKWILVTRHKDRLHRAHGPVFQAIESAFVYHPMGIETIVKRWSALIPSNRTKEDFAFLIVGPYCSRLFMRTYDKKRKKAGWDDDDYPSKEVAEMIAKFVRHHPDPRATVPDIKREFSDAWGLSRSYLVTRHVEWVSYNREGYEAAENAIMKKRGL